MCAVDFFSLTQEKSCGSSGKILDCWEAVLWVEGEARAQFHAHSGSCIVQLLETQWQRMK